MFCFVLAGGGVVAGAVSNAGVRGSADSCGQPRADTARCDSGSGGRQGGAGQGRTHPADHHNVP